ncbi:MAG: nucleotidyl transferase AbiEii/AbiGii toxin family protein [bacterium]
MLPVAFDINKHVNILVRILKEIYSDDRFNTFLGFKGGTAAMLFYKLDRGSVDLDFDLLDERNEDLIMTEMPKLLSNFGKLIEATKKKNTLFFLLDYGYGIRKVKVEISKRKSLSRFEVKNYLGISMLVMNLEDAVSNKLCALIKRSHFASRDMYDLNFFLNQDIPLNKEIVRDITGMTLSEAYKRAADMVNKISESKILDGLGELIDRNKKVLVKKNLKSELLFNLQLYIKKEG